MTNVILCGGVGSRFWPLSRAHLPKQFAQILPGSSLFENTVKRNVMLGMNLFIASNKDQYFLASNQLRGLGIHDFSALIEPMGRNTAPAIALACLSLPVEELVLVTPSDHVIQDEGLYATAVEAAVTLAKSGKIVTFGIVPSYAETGFGYIEADGSKVLSFREKPDAATAAIYLASGRYLWNSGMFCFQVGTLLQEIAALAPELLARVQDAYGHVAGSNPLFINDVDMNQIPAISIDYAVMEKSKKIACVACPPELGWSDLGSFDAVYEHLVKDKSGTACKAEIDPVVIGGGRNLVLASSRQVALAGVEDLIIVECADAVLVAKRGESQDVKYIYEALKVRNSSLVERFPRVERPWGHYDLLQDSPDLVVKRIEVQAGHRLSLHRHHFRDEHWTIVSGTGKVQIDNTMQNIKSGDTVLVKRFSIHRLENSGKETLVLVETQLGSQLCESDIERYEDDYDRECLV